MSRLSGVRQREMLELIRRQGHCTITELCERFAVSVPTAHRDINALGAGNKVRKVHGGVEYVSPSVADSSWNSSFEVRINRHRAKKQEIARNAAGLVDPDDVVFLDSSTTALYLARELARTDFGRLTIVTNSCCIASEFHRFPRHMTLISIGGVYNAQLNSFLGGIAREAVEGLRISKVFLSAVGVSEQGIFTFHEDHAAFLRRLVDRCETSVLLADSSKIGREALFRICGLGQLGMIISDRELPDTVRQCLSTAAGTALT